VFTACQERFHGTAKRWRIVEGRHRLTAAMLYKKDLVVSAIVLRYSTPESVQFTIGAVSNENSQTSVVTTYWDRLFFLINVENTVAQMKGEEDVNKITHSEICEFINCSGFSVGSITQWRRIIRMGEPVLQVSVTVLV
jgi:hypothetical protein